MRKVVLNIFVFLFICGCSKPNDSQDKILFVTSNQHTYGNTDLNAANHFAEIAIAYEVFLQNGFDVDIMSPKGGAIPLGYISTSDSIQKKLLYDAMFMKLLKNTKSPLEIIPSDYKAIYFSGGGAAMFGVPENEEIQSIASDIYKNKGVVAAVCHGTAGLINLKIGNNFIYQNKRITGYPELFENTAAEYYQAFPFSIEKKIISNGGNFIYSKKRNDNFTVEEGRLVTGQDPSATAEVANKVVQILNNMHLIKN